jgi:hypothetical protein
MQFHRNLGKMVGIGTLLAGSMLAAVARPLTANPVLIPIVAYVYGQDDASWMTEVRITNRTDSSKEFRIVDWIGTPGWKASTYAVVPHSTTSLGGANIFGAFAATGAVGLAICDADAGLLIQSAILSGTWHGTGGVSYSCASYDGGGVSYACPGFAGAGPIIEGLAFSPAGQDVYIPWLHTATDRRTNLVLINPDDVLSHVTVSMLSQDGTATATGSYILPPRSYNQVNDLFSQEPWSAIYVANSYIQFGGAAASATIRGDTRLLAMAYVIGNYNNSLTISLPH